MQTSNIKMIFSFKHIVLHLQDNTAKIYKLYNTRDIKSPPHIPI